MVPKCCGVRRVALRVCSDMATSWPLEVAWPAEHREHATQLTKYLRDALASMDSSSDRPVPPKQVKFVIHGMISLLAKIRNVPDLSTIHDSLKSMQTEARLASTETAQALEKVKEEIHGSTAEIAKNTADGEEVKQLAR